MADLMIIAPHPDDAELHAGGLIARHVRLGATVVVVDASRGEGSSRGDPVTRAREADSAATVLGVSARVNLGLPDGGIVPGDLSARMTLVSALRTHRPRQVIALSEHARHPDHRHLAALVRDAVKAAAFHRYVPELPAMTGMRLWWCEAELPMTAPTVLVPLTAADWALKMAAILAHKSQFHDPASAGPDTAIAAPGFLTWIEARARTWGHHAGAEFAEALQAAEPLIVGDLCREPAW